MWHRVSTKSDRNAWPPEPPAPERRPREPAVGNAADEPLQVAQRLPGQSGGSRGPAGKRGGRTGGGVARSRPKGRERAFLCVVSGASAHVLLNRRLVRE